MFYLANVKLETLKHGDAVDEFLGMLVYSIPNYHSNGIWTGRRRDLLRFLNEATILDEESFPVWKAEVRKWIMETFVKEKRITLYLESPSW